MDKLKDKWRDIVVVLLVISNLFLVYSVIMLKKDISYVSDKAYDLETEVDEVKRTQELDSSLLSIHRTHIDALEARVDELETRNMFKPFW